MYSSCQEIKPVAYRMYQRWKRAETDIEAFSVCLRVLQHEYTFAAHLSKRCVAAVLKWPPLVAPNVLITFKRQYCWSHSTAAQLYEPQENTSLSQLTDGRKQGTNMPSRTGLASHDLCVWWNSGR